MRRRVSRDVPVGFSQVDIKVELVPALPVGSDKIAMLIKAAEASCLVLQTIMNPPTISVARNS